MNVEECGRLDKNKTKIKIRLGTQRSYNCPAYLTVKHED